jgi:hypothetical protein
VTAAVAKDVTAPLRMRRYRERQKANESKADVTVSTIEMCSLASRLGDGRATAADLRMAERLIMHLVMSLPEDSTVEVS